MWCISTLDAEFISKMERLLHLYSQDPDPEYPLVCFDEKSYQVVGDTIAPINMRSGKPKRTSDKYLRNGTQQILVAYLPNFGKRFTWVSPKRKAVDFAFFMMEFLKSYLPTILPSVKGIRLVCDNLNTHSKASFYKTFHAAIAFEFSNLVDFHYTPVNGSWLNMAEIEIHALSVQCLNRRMKDQKFVSTELRSIVDERNKNSVKTLWQFSIPMAREKFSRFYNKLNN